MTIDAAAVIETERLRLERWDERHTPLLVRLASMPEVMHFIGTGDPWPPLLAEDVARAERRHWEQHGFGWRATVDKETGRGIGLVSLNYAGEGTAGLDPGEREIGWWLEPDAWGRGLGTEGSAALRDEAFDVLGDAEHHRPHPAPQRRLPRRRPQDRHGARLRDDRPQRRAPGRLPDGQALARTGV